MSIANLAASAFTAVAGHFPDAVKPCTLKRITGSEYNPETGMVETTFDETAGHVVFDTVRPQEDSLPSLIPGPSDLLCWLEGLEWAPQEADELLADGVTFTVMQGADVAMTGGAFAAVVRRS